MVKWSNEQEGDWLEIGEIKYLFSKTWQIVEISQWSHIA